MSVISIEIPDQYDIVVLQAIKLLVNNQLDIRIKGDVYRTSQKFSFANKSALETNPEFVKRVFSKTIRALVRLSKLHEDKVRFNDEISIINPPKHSIPDNILTGTDAPTPD